MADYNEFRDTSYEDERNKLAKRTNHHWKYAGAKSEWVCMECRALTDRPEEHYEWHKRVEEKLNNPIQTIGPGAWAPINTMVDKIR